METNLHYTNKQLAYNINMKKNNNMKKITTRVLNLMDYFKCYKVITRTTISKKKWWKINVIRQTSHIPIPHAKHPTSQISHLSNFPHPAHPTYQTSHILKIPHLEHPIFWKSHIPNIKIIVALLFSFDYFSVTQIS